jgi:hypothetical protein
VCVCVVAGVDLPMIMAAVDYFPMVAARNYFVRKHDEKFKKFNEFLLLC